MENDFFNIPDDCEILSSRTFNTTPAAVFDAWTDPDKLKQWWGPAGFTNTFHQFDLRPGGTWKFTMHGPDKGNYENEVVFHKIDAPKIIVWDRVSKPLFRVVATFDEVGDGSTRLVFRMQFDNKRDCDKIRPFATEKNEENFDKLEKVLGL